VHGHEITGERRRRLLAQEAAPGELVSLRRGRQAVAEEDRPHRGRRNRDAEALQFADDSSVAPTRVLACERNNKRLQATIEPRPPGPPVRIRPAPPDQLTVPAQQRRRTHRQGRPGASRQRPRKRGEDRSIDGTQPRSPRLGAGAESPARAGAAGSRVPWSAPICTAARPVEPNGRAPDRRTTRPSTPPDLREREAIEPPAKRGGQTANRVSKPHEVGEGAIVCLLVVHGTDCNKANAARLTNSSDRCVHSTA
jgi:hypothetical protein